MTTDRGRSLDPAVRQLAELYKRCEQDDVPTDVKESVDKTLDIMDAKKAYCKKNTVSDTPNARMIVEKTHTTPWEQLFKEGKISTLCHPIMMSGAGQGQFLQFLARMQKAKRFLEIGMFTGYVAMAMAEALPDDGKVVTCDIDPYLVESARKTFDETPFGKKIATRLGPAMDTLDQLASEGHKFDLVYLDADKEGYLGYYQKLLDKNLLADGGMLVVDNTFEFGFAYTKPDTNLDNFNNAVMADQRVEQVMLPIFDGVSLIRRKGE